jgi:hypothetical protein
MTVVHQVGRRIYPKGQEELAQHARDVQEIFNKIPVVEHRMIESYYAEPMTLLVSEEPFCIELVRIANVFALEQPVSAAYGMLHYVFRPNLGGAQITKIGGLDVPTNGTTKYRFYYRITYRMVGSHG